MHLVILMFLFFIVFIVFQVVCLSIDGHVPCYVLERLNKYNN